MNIGIMTMHRTENAGSFLQAYSLKKNLEERGHSVCFVDFHDEQFGEEYICKTNQTRNSMYYAVRRIMGDLLSIPGSQKYKERKMIHAFNSYHKQMTEKLMPKVLNVSKDFNYDPDIDVLLVGSDEVFNISHRGFLSDMFGERTKAKKKVTYAASFGNTTYEDIEKNNLHERLKEDLSSFSALSVRDDNSQGLVKRITGIDATINLDPVFIYDYSAEMPEINEKDYIVVYAYPGRFSEKEIKTIKSFAVKTGKKLYCMGGYHTFCDKYIVATPFEILSYFKNADYVVTDTFHGTIFSIKFNKAFATFVRKGHGEIYGNEEKVGYLLKQFNLNDHRVDENKDLEKVLNKSTAWNEVNNKIIEEQRRSKAYLDDALGSE